MYVDMLDKMVFSNLESFLNGYTIDQLEEMYVYKKYSMRLVSSVTKIKIAPLSRIIRQFEFPEKRRKLYKTENNAFRDEVHFVDKYQRKKPETATTAEEDFFNDL